MCSYCTDEAIATSKQGWITVYLPGNHLSPPVMVWISRQLLRHLIWLFSTAEDQESKQLNQNPPKKSTA